MIDSYIKVITDIVENLIDDDSVSDEEIYQLGVRLSNLSQDCHDSINYEDEE